MKHFFICVTTREKHIQTLQLKKSTDFQWSGTAALCSLQVDAPYSYENQQDNKFGSLLNYYYYTDMTENSISLLSKAMLHNLGKLFILSVRTMDDFFLPQKKNTHKVPLLLLSKMKKMHICKNFWFCWWPNTKEAEESVISTIWLNGRFCTLQYGRLPLLWTSAEIFIINSLEYRA